MGVSSRCRRAEVVLIAVRDQAVGCLVNGIATGPRSTIQASKDADLAETAARDGCPRTQSRIRHGVVARNYRLERSTRGCALIYLTLGLVALIEIHDCDISLGIGHGGRGCIDCVVGEAIDHPTILPSSVRRDSVKARRTPVEARNALVGVTGKIIVGNC